MRVDHPASYPCVIDGPGTGASPASIIWQIETKKPQLELHLLMPAGTNSNG